MTSIEVEQLAASFDEATFLIGVALFLIEIIHMLVSGTFLGGKAWDMLASFSTQIPSLLIESVLFAGFHWLATSLSNSFITWSLPVNGWTLALALILCDFAYYWEHRVAHEVRLFWTQHAVHHSSRFMNTSVAVRFGPLEGIVSLLVHTPLLLLGFPPSLVFFGIVTVLAYQTWIHTELIGKLGFFDAIFNTPSNHRVHHGADEKYLDKNYGGILIIWDQIFGTYQHEEETPRYGLKGDFSSVNPFVVWVSELPSFFRQITRANSLPQAWRVIWESPANKEAKNT